MQMLNKKTFFVLFFCIVFECTKSQVNSQDILHHIILTFFCTNEGIQNTLKRAADLPTWDDEKKLRVRAKINAIWEKIPEDRRFVLDSSSMVYEIIRELGTNEDLKVQAKNLIHTIASSVSYLWQERFFNELFNAQSLDSFLEPVNLASHFLDLFVHSPVSSVHGIRKPFYISDQSMEQGINNTMSQKITFLEILYSLHKENKKREKEEFFLKKYFGQKSPQEEHKQAVQKFAAGLYQALLVHVGLNPELKKMKKLMKHIGLGVAVAGGCYVAYRYFGKK